MRCNRTGALWISTIPQLGDPDTNVRLTKPTTPKNNTRTSTPATDQNAFNATLTGRSCGNTHVLRLQMPHFVWQQTIIDGTEQQQQQPAQVHHPHLTTTQPLLLTTGSTTSYLIRIRLPLTRAAPTAGCSHTNRGCECFCGVLAALPLSAYRRRCSYCCSDVLTQNTGHKLPHNLIDCDRVDMETRLVVRPEHAGKISQSSMHAVVLPVRAIDTLTNTIRPTRPPHVLSPQFANWSPRNCCST